MTRLACAAVLAWGVTACGDDAVGSDGRGTPSNLARFTFDCDLQGVTGVLTMDVEAVAGTGAVYGPGPDPAITGVIATGGVIYYTAGELRSPSAYYFFTGENQFADFTEPATFERFRVMWEETRQGLRMVVNPFGPAPGYHDCALTSAQYR